MILLMHGLGSQLLLWEEGFCECLAATGFRVVRYDHRDSGLSTMVEDGDSYTLADMAADAVGLLDHLGAKSAHIVGFSLGGMIAQTFAIEYPDRTRSLVSMGSNTGNLEFGVPSSEILVALVASAPDAPGERVEKDLADRRLWASPEWHDDDHALATFTRYAARSIQSSDAFNRQFAAGSGNREEALKTLNVPTCVVHGTADTLIPMSGGQRTAAIVPGAVIVLIEGWGHDLPAGAWPHLVDAISTHALNVEAALSGCTTTGGSNGSS
ncbi:MAG TPA: alpha/beta hydrolase [Acidimicrobiaceae bacterium]|jgi:pimeloyl-ACP methyl ester carboxylesterase|nr:alpha/beta hydrolase [Acidimicrobiaceae bacterium]HCV37112.1 alpha/beta hydrolase [Acidimicrobiaceae bacterium]